MLLIRLLWICHFYACIESQRNGQFYIQTNAHENNNPLAQNLLKTICLSPSRISCALKCTNYAGCTTIYYDVSSKQCKLLSDVPNRQHVTEGSEQNYFKQANLQCQRAGTEFNKEIGCCQPNYGGKDCKTLKIGFVKSRPANNCKWIFDTFPRSQSSIYWIQELEGPEEMYCDKAPNNEVNIGTATSVMTCSKADENKSFKHPAGKCRSYIKCSRNQAWLVKCSGAANEKFVFYNETQKRCVKNEECFEYQQDDVCYGTRDSSFGTFTVTETGYITKVKLVHQSGFLKNQNLPFTSIWGFPDSKMIGTLITDSNNKVLFGSLDHYTVEDFNDESPYLILPNVTAVYANEGDVLRVWYSEDIRDTTEADNSGTHCIAVYATFIN